MPPRLTALLAACTLALLVGAWRTMEHGAATPAADPAPDAATAGLAPGPGGCDADGVVLGPPGWTGAPPRRLALGAEPTPGERLADLVTDLELLRPVPRDPGGERAVVRRLEQYVLDVAAAGERGAAVAALAAAVDALTATRVREAVAGRTASVAAAGDEPPGGGDAWLSARLLVALAGLDAGDAVLARCDRLSELDLGDVVVALAWDPLASPDAPRVLVRRAEGLVRGPPLLPLELTRAPSPAVREALVRCRQAPRRGPHALRVRDAASLALGAGLGADPALAERLVAALAREDDAQVARWMRLALSCL